MQHVVVATDLTPASETAVERAATASRAMGAGLRLVHMLPELMPPLVGPARVRKAEAALHYRAQSLHYRLGARVTSNVVKGDTSRGIVRESENLGAVLTVFGRRTDGGESLRLIGTTLERSLRLIRNAALIVRDRSPVRASYRKALLAPDGGVDEQSLMPYMHHLAPDAAVHRIDRLSPGGGRKARQKVADQVRAMRRALDADLLVIGMPRDETLNPFRFRRLLTSLVRAPECDTLIVPQECDVVPVGVVEPGQVRIAS